MTTPIGGFRIHGEQFTQKQIDRINEVCEAPSAATAAGRTGR